MTSCVDIGILFHLYTDDTQLYLSFKIEETKDTLKKMELCIAENCTSNVLRPNDNKTKVLLIESKYMLRKIPYSVLYIGNDTMSPMETVI